MCVDWRLEGREGMRREAVVVLNYFSLDMLSQFEDYDSIAVLLTAML